jgi:hypothetical protein
MLARDNQLRVGERECLGSPGIGRVSGADVGSDALRGGGIAGAMGVAQFFRLFLVLLEVRNGQADRGQAYESPFTAPGVRPVRLKEGSS